MFVSTRWLVTSHNIDPDIAKFFVDREPPKDNFLWKNRLLYLQPTDGYLFIPCIVDLLYRLGIDKAQLLDEAYVQTFERILDVSVREEKNLITMQEAIRQCNLVVENKVVNQPFYDQVSSFMLQSGPTELDVVSVPQQALHRGDVFLFSFVALQFPPHIIRDVANAWFTLIVNYLIMDDVEDYRDDLQSGSENAFTETGISTADIAAIYNLFHQNLQFLSRLNPGIAKAQQEIFTSRIKKADTFQAFKDVALPWL